MEFLKFAPIAIVVLVVVLLCLLGYVKAPPDTAYIISGLRKRTVIGKAAVKVPFFERLDKLSLQLISVDIKPSRPVPTADYINLSVDGVVNIKVSDSPDAVNLASQNFLNRDVNYIQAIAKEVLEGNMREIVGRMTLKEMVSERQKFAEEVKKNADPDLAAMGLNIVSFTVQNFSDENGIINDLGIDNISQIKKVAAIAKADANKEIAVAQAEADRQANEARINSEREIAKKNNEFAIQVAELKKKEDIAKAEADAAYAIQEQEQRKSIEISTANADIAKQEREIELKQKEAQVQEEALNASIKKQADAELYRRQKEADAERYEREREAEAELVMKLKQAEGIKAIGEAEAEAIRQKGIAEAEAMEKKAEAYEKYGKAAIAEMIIGVLPEVAARIAEPLTQIDKITIIGGGYDSGMNSAADGVPVVMAKLMETMKSTTGIDLANLINADSYDAKVNRKVELSGEIKGISGITKEKSDLMSNSETLSYTEDQCSDKE